jgi:hypothetical protein
MALLFTGDLDVSLDDNVGLLVPFVGVGIEAVTGEAEGIAEIRDDDGLGITVGC